MKSALTFLAAAAIVSTTIVGAEAKTPVLSPIDFLSCANYVANVGAPNGATIGNAETKFSALTFTLLNPQTGNDSWAGTAGASLDIKVSVASPNAVYLVMNSLYGQSGITNATVELKGTGGVRKTFKLKGNKTIRDYNNWVWTNTLSGKTAEEWWTNNLNPQPDDQSHRQDAHEFNIKKPFAGQSLTDIIIKAPANAGANYMEPLLFAVSVDAGLGSGTLPSTCATK
jgi:hypothetical protein